MSNFIPAFLAVLAVSLASLVGVVTLGLGEKRLNRLLLVLVSLSVGALLGDVFLHILPELFQEKYGTVKIASLIFGGIIIFFVLEKFLRWQHRHGIDKDDCREEHDLKHLGQLNLISEALHNLIDGLIIGASFLVNFKLGLATTLAVLLHELPQEIGDFGLLLYSGFSKKRALALNFLSALAAFGGLALVFIFGELEGFTSSILPITAGGFLYIAGSDLVPELHKESDPARSLLQLGTMILGFVLMGLLLFLE